MGEAKEKRIEQRSKLDEQYIRLGRQFAELMRNVDSVDVGGRGNRFCIGNLGPGFLFLITKDAEFMQQVDGLAQATIGPNGSTGKEMLTTDGDFEPMDPNTKVIPDPETKH